METCMETCKEKKKRISNKEGCRPSRLRQKQEQNKIVSLSR